MTAIESSIQDEIDDIKMNNRPHVVILGAGASKAAFPNGDRNGKQLPLMNDLVSMLDLKPMLLKAWINYSGENFELLYSQLHSNPKFHSILSEIEARIYDYFSTLELPDEPTIYDYLVLSLRKKDIIATFNRDPLLWLACFRNHSVISLPQIAFLHGNVAVGYCEKCIIMGDKRFICSKCGDHYKSSDLLFPITHKDYNNEKFIKLGRNALRNRLPNAYIFSIFWYSAPNSDVEAMNILEQARWNTKNKSQEQIEIICRPGGNHDQILNSREKFIFSHHVEVHEDYFSSSISRHPRRSCEAMFNTLINVQYLDDNLAPRGVSLIELQQRFSRFKWAEKI